MERKALAPAKTTKRDYYRLFIQSRQAMQVTEGTLQFYGVKLGRFLAEVNPDVAQRQDIESFLLQFENPGNRNAYYRAIKTLFNWREETFGLLSPMQHMKAPKIPFSPPFVPKLTLHDF